MRVSPFEFVYHVDDFLLLNDGYGTQNLGVDLEIFGFVRLLRKQDNRAEERGAYQEHDATEQGTAS